MVLPRGSVVLIPFPYSDLSTRKTRPAVVVNSMAYYNARAELLLAYVSSQITQAHSTLDYLLVDWQSTGLLKPSFVRPKLAAIDPNLIVHQIGNLSDSDLQQVDVRLRRALSLETQSQQNA